jgi:hypothetical protein
MKNFVDMIDYVKSESSINSMVHVTELFNMPIPDDGVIIIWHEALVKH